MSRWGKNIYEIPVDPSKWSFFNPASILLGMDGSLYVRAASRTWHTEKSYNFKNDHEAAQIRRMDTHAWEIKIPENEEIAAGDILHTDDVWVEVELWEPMSREPLNRVNDSFAQLSTAMQNFGTTVTRAGRAMERLMLSTPLTVQPGTRRGSKVYHVNVVDRDTNQMSVMVLSESKYKKLLKIGGPKLNQIICDDMNADIQEDGTEEYLTIMSVLDNL